MVAAIGEQILGPTDVSLSNWTVRPSSGCSVVLATHTAGVSVDGYTLTLAANPWNIVRTYNLTPGESSSSPAATGSARPSTSWCTCPRPRDLADAVPTCEAARPRRDKAIAFEALKADVGGRCRRHGPALGKSAANRLQVDRPSSTSARTRGGRRSTAWW